MKKNISHRNAFIMISDVIKASWRVVMSGKLTDDGYLIDRDLFAALKRSLKVLKQG